MKILDFYLGFDYFIKTKANDRNSHVNCECKHYISQCCIVACTMVLRKYKRLCVLRS